MYSDCSRITSMKFGAFCMTTLSGSLTKPYGPSTLVTLSTCDVNSLTSAPAARVFVELILLYTTSITRRHEYSQSPVWESQILYHVSSPSAIQFSSIKEGTELFGWTSSSAGHMYASALGSPIILGSFKPIFLKLFLFRTMRAKFLEGECPELLIIIGEILSPVWNWVHRYYIPHYSSDVWEPLRSWHPGKLLYWPAP